MFLCFFLGVFTMPIENLKEKINYAREQVSGESEFKKETFLAVLIAELLQKKELDSQSQEVETRIIKPKLKQLSIKEFLIDNDDICSIQ